MKRSELTNKQKLFVPCPICAAAIGEHCQMYSGLGRRNEPHAERKYQRSKPSNNMEWSFVSQLPLAHGVLNVVLSAIKPNVLISA